MNASQKRWLCCTSVPKMGCCLAFYMNIFSCLEFMMQAGCTWTSQIMGWCRLWTKPVPFGDGSFAVHHGLRDLQVLNSVVGIFGGHTEVNKWLFKRNESDGICHTLEKPHLQNCWKAWYPKRKKCYLPISNFPYFRAFVWYFFLGSSPQLLSIWYDESSDFLQFSGVHPSVMGKAHGTVCWMHFSARILCGIQQAQIFGVNV